MGRNKQQRIRGRFRSVRVKENKGNAIITKNAGHNVKRGSLKHRRDMSSYRLRMLHFRKIHDDMQCTRLGAEPFINPITHPAPPASCTARRYGQFMAKMDAT